MCGHQGRSDGVKLANQQRAFSGTAVAGFSEEFEFRGGAICRQGGGETVTPRRRRQN